ncbi:MAG: ferredoxin [Desulfosalsimonas sp.]
MDDCQVAEPEVELSECIRCGVCEEVCPEVFVITNAGYVQVADLDDYPADCVDEAIKNCPARCIRWL